MLNICGIDPALRNTGVVRGVLDTSSRSIRLSDCLLITTEPSTEKILKSADDLERSQHIHTQLHKFIKDVDLVFCEMPVGSQTSRAQTSYGIIIGLLASIKTPIIRVSPLEVKHVVGATKTTTKKEIITWAVSIYPWLSWMRTKKGIITNQNEHVADAIATIHAGLETEQFKQAATFIEK